MDVNVSHDWSSTEAQEDVTNVFSQPQPSIDSFLSYRVAEWLRRYVLPVLIFGGGLSNLLTMVALRRPTLGWSADFLLRLMIVADSFVLCSLLPLWIRVLIPEWNPTIPMWKLTWFFSYFADDCSAWTLVLLESQAAVTLSLKKKKQKNLCTRTAIVTVWLVSTLLLAAVNTLPLFLSWECSDPVTETCQPADQQYREEILPRLDLSIDTFVPGLLLGGIAIGFIKLRQLKVSSGVPLTLMWALTLLFLITKLPFGIFVMLVEGQNYIPRPVRSRGDGWPLAYLDSPRSVGKKQQRL